MINFILALLFSSSTLAAETIPQGCINHRNFSAEAYKLWMGLVSQQQATAEASNSKPVSINQRTEVSMLSEGEGYAGFVSFEIKEAGNYVVVTDLYPRMDLRNAKSGEDINPIDFGKIRDCGTVNKSLLFEFDTEAKVFLKFSSVDGPKINLMIWRMPK